MYEGSPPWDIGRPQPAFVRLFQDGEIKHGHILDVGCGTGENALFLAENGCDVSGVDIAHRAIGIAKQKAAKRNLNEIALRMDAGRRALMERGDDEVGPYQSPMEDGMQQFHEWYRRVMKGKG